MEAGLTKSRNDPSKLTREISEADNAAESLSWKSLIDDYLQAIEGKSPRTVTAYARTLRQFMSWLTGLPGHDPQFRAEQFTRSALEIYLSTLEKQNYSVSHRERVKAAISGFSRWLIEDRALLRRNPSRGIHIAAEGK